MRSQAPYAYIRDYYRSVQRKYDRFPAELAFCRSMMGQIRGPDVLNAGCGPLLYDDLLHLGAAPRSCVGLDLNRSTFEFLRRSRDPRLLRAKRRAQALGSRIEFLCADIFESEPVLRGRFDGVLGVGFFATLYGPRFGGLMRLLHRTLKTDGRLVKLTWHGPQRSPEETRKKLAYRYDTTEAPTPEQLVAGIEMAGFELLDQSLHGCDPDTYGWNAIQACVFRKT